MVNIIIGTGISFELPIVSYVLTKIGLVTPAFLQAYRKYAYVIILLVAAVITPSPDWMSQTLVAVPLFILFELSIMISKRVENENLRKEAAFFSK
jgi:sec-independent protein translocase protein TatC